MALTLGGAAVAVTSRITGMSRQTFAMPCRATSGDLRGAPAEAMEALTTASLRGTSAPCSALGLSGVAVTTLSALVALRRSGHSSGPRVRAATKLAAEASEGVPAEQAKAEPKASPKAEPKEEAEAKAKAEAETEAEKPGTEAAAEAEAEAEGLPDGEEAPKDDAEAEAETTEEKPAEEGEAKKEDKPKKWICIDCGSSNFPAATECHKCGASKPSAAESALMDEKRQAQEEVGKVMDKFLRLQADLQNYRRQHTEKMSRAEVLGKEDALRRLLPVSMEVEEALKPKEGLSDREQALFSSYSLLFGKLPTILEKFGVSRMEVEVPSKLDQVKHRKVGERQPEGDEAPGTITKVVSQGWMCEGKVLIPAEVEIVAFPPEEEPEPPKATTEDEEMAEDDLEEEEEAAEEEAESKETGAEETQKEEKEAPKESSSDAKA